MGKLVAVLRGGAFIKIYDLASFTIYRNYVTFSTWVLARDKQGCVRDPWVSCASV